MANRDRGSMYITMCSCGAEIRTVNKQGKCKKCGKEFCLEWPAEYRRVVKEVKTISERYEDAPMGIQTDEPE